MGSPCESTSFINKAHETQRRLSKHIVFKDKLPKKIHLVAGVDVAYHEATSVGVVAVLATNSLELVESQTALCATRLPYMPTLLSFREIPPMLRSIKKLQVQPDLFLVDGQGFAHPYRCGLASHLGLILGKPTIGVAKSRLFGEVEIGKIGDRLLRHEREILGAEVVTKPRSKPVYVSVGHMISLKTAIRIVKQCTHNTRIPEPILEH